MNIMHFSDSHGVLPHLEGDFDVIVCSGDWLPTKGRRIGERIDKRRESIYQIDWVHRKRDAIKSWARGKPLLISPGNHDFYDATAALRHVGVEAYNLWNERCEIDGVSFFGFPWVPWIDGEWNYESNESAIAERFLSVPDVDILVTHSPPRGVLDLYNGEHYGSTALLEGLRSRRKKPRAVLCGHIHSGYGYTVTEDGYAVSNAATGSRTLVLPERVAITV